MEEFDLTDNFKINLKYRFHLLLCNGRLTLKLMITEGRTKPLRGRNKGWCEAPFF